MKAVILTAPGGVANLQLAEIATPVPGAEEGRIRVLAAGFNPSDYKMRQGGVAEDGPIILGGEVAGIIDAVGPAVAEFHVGPAVCAHLPRRWATLKQYAATRRPWSKRELIVHPGRRHTSWPYRVHLHRKGDGSSACLPHRRRLGWCWEFRDERRRLMERLRSSPPLARIKREVSHARTWDVGDSIVRYDRIDDHQLGESCSCHER